MKDNERNIDRSPTNNRLVKTLDYYFDRTTDANSYNIAFLFAAQAIVDRDETALWIVQGKIARKRSDRSPSIHFLSTIQKDPLFTNGHKVTEQPPLAQYFEPNTLQIDTTLEAQAAHAILTNNRQSLAAVWNKLQQTTEEEITSEKLRTVLKVMDAVDQILEAKAAGVLTPAEKMILEMEQTMNEGSKLFELGRASTLTKGVHSDAEKTRSLGLAEEVILDGIYQEKKYRVTYTKIRSDDNFSENWRGQKGKLLTDDQEVKIEGRNIFASITFRNYLDVQTDENDQQYRFEMNYNDHNVNVVQLLRDIEPVTRKNTEADDQTTETTVIEGFVVYDSLNPSSLQTDTLVVASNIDEATKVFVDACEATGDYRSIKSLHQGITFMHPMTHLILSRRTRQDKPEPPASE